MKKSRNRFLCLDCRVDTGKIGEYYYIKIDLWLSVVGSKYGMLCIGCLEKRLGRILTAQDFTSAWINEIGVGRKSERFISRLTDSGLDG